MFSSRWARGRRRARSRQAHGEEGPERARPVDAGGLDELVGHGLAQVLRHPEHAEGTHESGHDDRAELPGPAEVAEQDVQRNDAQLRRHGHRRDDEDEQEARRQQTAERVQATEHNGHEATAKLDLSPEKNEAASLPATSRKGSGGRNQPADRKR